MLTKTQQRILFALHYSLFGGAKPKLNNVDISALADEAKAQAVFPFVFTTYRDELEAVLTPQQFGELDAEYYSAVINGVRVESEHGELQEIMTAAGIPYVIMKGCASAMYYPEPALRSMGDVDFLVHESDIPRGIKALEENGFHRDQYEFTTNQSAYLRPPMSTWEIHKSPSGIPKGAEGEAIRTELADMIETAELYVCDSGSFMVPDKYHHGLILLLHKISHMTTTGIGLRHLCDWAVFESSLTNEEFVGMFEQKLKIFGIWKFAQIMTLVCEKYMGAPKREWAQNPDVEPRLLEDIILDIFAGGNFGHKDENRQREIKYLTDRKQEKFGERNIIAQAFSSLNAKVYTNHRFIDRNRVFLPFGWMIEGGRYVGSLFSGKRKSTGTTAMLKEAAKRKKIYANLSLFR